MKYITEDNNIIEKVKRVERNLTHLLEDVQHLSVQLRPSLLDDLGLESAFRSHFKLIEKNYGLVTNFESNIHTKRYAGEIETNVYRICQEGVLNALKYAQVDEITVKLLEKNNCLHLTVIDKGVGFLVEKGNPRGTGLGLYGMRERAELIRGEFTIHSTLNKGTEICVIIPI